VVEATIVRAWGATVRVATTLEDGVRDPGRHIVYSGPVLFDLTITFLVVRSFTNKSNGSNFIEHQFVSGKPMNIEDTLNHVRSKQNIVKVKWPRKNRVPH
jgi:hypothetical protein